MMRLPEDLRMGYIPCRMLALVACCLWLVISPGLSLPLGRRRPGQTLNKQDIPLSAIIHHLQRRAAPQQHSQIPTLDNHTIQDRPRGISDTAKRPPAKTRAAPTSPPCKKAGRRYLESWFKKKVITDALPVSSCRNAECENRGKGNAVCPSISTWDYDADRYPPFVPSVRCLRAPPREDGLECLPVAIRRKVLFRNKRVCRSGGKERWDVQQKEVGSSHCAFSSRSTPGAHSKR